MECFKFIAQFCGFVLLFFILKNKYSSSPLGVIVTRICSPYTKSVQTKQSRVLLRHFLLSSAWLIQFFIPHIWDFPSKKSLTTLQSKPHRSAHPNNSLVLNRIFFFLKLSLFSLVLLRSVGSLNWNINFLPLVLFYSNA